MSDESIDLGTERPAATLAAAPKVSAQRRLPTFSSLQRAFVCRASTVLPQTESVNEYATAGTVMHRFLERVNELRATLPPEDAAIAAIAEAPEEERDFLAAIPIEELPTDPKRYAAEVALAYDVATGRGRELGRGIERKYEEAALALGAPLRPTEIVGSLDLGSLVNEDGAFAADWKRGGRYVKPVRENWQIRAGLLAACRTWGRTWGRGSIVRVFDHGDTYVDATNFTAVELDQSALRLTQLAVRIARDRKAHAAGERVPATISEECRYCASFRHCPDATAMARSLGNEPEALKGQMKALVTRENAGEFRRRLQMAKRLVDELEAFFDTWAGQELAEGRPLEVEPGIYYAPVPHPRDVIDGAKAMAVLQGEFAAEILQAEFPADVTKAALGRALKKKTGLDRGITKMTAELVERLRKAGAIKATTSYWCEAIPLAKLSKKTGGNGGKAA